MTQPGLAAGPAAASLGGMTPEHAALWQRIAAFALDEAGAEHSYSVRLADEQGWSLAYARRVIAEYKRFAFLAVTAGHPVTPSKAVDEAWHLHLIYTRSYWGEFCPHILQRPLHHEPSRGGEVDEAKYAGQYRQTLESYTRAFGAAPPEDVWPRSTKMPSAPRLSPVGRLRAWLPVAGVSLGLGGCASTVIGVALRPLDYTGPEFLRFFGIFSVVMFAVALGLRWWLRQPASSFGRRLDSSDLYAVAALQGVDQALGVGLAVLSEKKLVHASTGRRALHAEGRVADDAPAVERKIHARAREGEGPGLLELRRTVERALEPTLKRLRDAGWLLSDETRWRVRFIPFMVALLVPLVAVAKIGIGIHRDRPVGFLAFGGIVTLVLAFLFLRKAWRSRAGDAELARLRTEYDALRREKSVGVGGLPSKALGVALFGAAVVAPAVAALTADISPLPNRSSDSGGGGSCGSSGGGGGDGGGGSGCGGCGGGGD